MINISKEDFCKAINRLKESQDQLIEIDRVLGAVCNLGDLSDTVIKLLEKLTDAYINDQFGSDISYFCWELDFGRNWTPDSITDMDDNPIDISTPEKLYDYLVACS